MIDTETANGLDQPLVYDLGMAVIDKKGRVYHAESLLIKNIFYQERELMQSAYYACKIPKYEQLLQQGAFRVVKFSEARKIVHTLCEKWNIKAIVAHNAKFDYRATSTTQRYITTGKFAKSRYFLPFGIPIWCTMTMAKCVLATQKSYIAWCEQQAEKRMFQGRPRVNAQQLYQYIIGDDNYIEEHMGLADVMIEKEIFAWAMRQKQAMQKSPYKEKDMQALYNQAMENGYCDELFQRIHGVQLV